MNSPSSPHVTPDGARLHYEDWGAGPPVVFTHGWSVGGEMWEYQMTALAERGLRCIAPDRRGCGRSTPGSGAVGYDQLADDLAGLLDVLDVTDVTLVAHSMGAGEAVRMFARHGAGAVARLVLVSPTTPRVLHAPDNPDGIPAAAFDAMAAGLSADKPAYLAASAPGFFGGPDAVSPELAAWGVALARRASLRTSVGLVWTFSGEDSRADLGCVTVPTLVIHGDADVSAPLGLCGRPTALGISKCRLEVYAGGPHGLPLASGHKERLTEDLAAFAAGAPG